MASFLTAAIGWMPTEWARGEEASSHIAIAKIFVRLAGMTEKTAVTEGLPNLLSRMAKGTLFLATATNVMKAYWYDVFSNQR
jgi:hypothetical protein